ncbi:DEAD/DEAH box helicase [Dasania marina]|uniref:DEAD/DEAH box helicase n=1 Tax=Dasania marina TaxID=471499 RepID=UPI000475D4BA|nr:DEAD/DEAH box helicase [Dasania marina]
MFSAMPLNERLLRALHELNIKTPTAVQQQAIPAALAGKDLRVSAATGTGKTIAFLLPVLQPMFEGKATIAEGSRCVILAPTRELAKQIFKTCKSLCRFSYLKTALIIGGEEFKYQQALLRKDPEIIIATPGRLLEHLQKGSALLSQLEFLVLDEADKMLELGFLDDVTAIAGHSNTQRQTLMFSATLERRGIAELSAGILNEPETIQVDTHRQQHKNIRQQVILADDYEHKKNLLDWLLSNETFGKALVFTNTKTDSNRVRGFLRGKKYRAASINSDMSQEDRSTTMTSFRSGATQILVATDVASRGIDINDIDLVINFDMARNGDDYIHRIGRTGRVEQKGLAISFITAKEWNLMAAIERYVTVSFEKRTIKPLLGKYKGPKKLKSSGKAASTTKRSKVKAAEPKKKKKKTGARPSRPVKALDGFAPIKKKK